jgi:quinoprotein glucose dehydrogenase
MPPSREGTIIFPGFDGGGEWGGAAVDPEGVLYVNSNEMPWVLTMVETASGRTAGAQLYLQNCAGCHGADLEGSPAQGIPSLVDVSQRMTIDEVETRVVDGFGIMPGFSFLSDKHRDAIVSYLMARPDAGAADGPGPELVGSTLFTHTGYRRWKDPFGYPAVKPPWGTLNAIDLNTGTYRWTVALGEYPELTARGIPKTGTENYGGPVVTASNLLFIAATNDECIRAFDTKTGEELWRRRLPAGGYATPAVYSVAGRQFVVVACGGGKMGTPSGDTYIAFALPE